MKRHPSYQAHQEPSAVWEALVVVLWIVVILGLTAVTQ